MHMPECTYTVPPNTKRMCVCIRGYMCKHTCNKFRAFWVAKYQWLIDDTVPAQISIVKTDTLPVQPRLISPLSNVFLTTQKHRGCRTWNCPCYFRILRHKRVAKCGNNTENSKLWGWLEGCACILQWDCQQTAPFSPHVRLLISLYRTRVNSHRCCQPAVILAHRLATQDGCQSTDVPMGKINEEEPVSPSEPLYWDYSITVYVSDASLPTGDSLWY